MQICIGNKVIFKYKALFIIYTYTYLRCFVVFAFLCNIRNHFKKLPVLEKLVIMVITVYSQGKQMLDAQKKNYNNDCAKCFCS